MVLLYKQIGDSEDEILSDITFERKLNYVQKAIESFINVIVGATATFYSLEEMVKPNKLSRELFVNMVTNLVIDGEIYFLLFNLTSLWMQEPLSKLQKVMNNQVILENELPISKLNIHAEMQFDVNVRNGYPKQVINEEEERKIKIVNCSGEPYAMVKS